MKPAPSRTARATARTSQRVGIIGGGQLARMTALAAAPLGCEVLVLERTPSSPAAQVCPGSAVGDWNDPQALLEFAPRVDVVTLENEFVDAGALAALEQAGHRVFPTSSTLALTQDKFVQKTTLQKAGLPVPEFRAVTSQADVLAAGRAFGWPLLLKARRLGYDGKGNFTVRSEGEVEAGWNALRGDRKELFVEAFWHFTKELAVMVTRGRTGELAVYPVVETIQRNHICHLVKAPASIAADIASKARDIAQRAIEAVGAIGTFGVEMFLSAAGEVAINELAPRVHNSGHYTIEACECSQFENHVRAVLGWPLGSTRMVAPAAVMLNLLGTADGPGTAAGLAEALRVAGAHIHLYGKASSGTGRKMGHVTALGQNVEQALAIAQKAAQEIHFGTKS